MRKLLILNLLFTIALSTVCQSNRSREIIIDETGKKYSLDQRIKIDAVWSGHPVGFCLMTNGNRQYVACYNI